MPSTDLISLSESEVKHPFPLRGKNILNEFL